MNPKTFRQELAEVINRNSAENGSETPDFLLAEYLFDCLSAYDRAVVARERWYGRKLGRAPDHECPKLPPSSNTPPGASRMEQAAEMLWCVIANVSEGDWSKQSPEWKASAARWRDNYFSLKTRPFPEAVDISKP